MEIKNKSTIIIIFILGCAIGFIGAIIDIETSKEGVICFEKEKMNYDSFIYHRLDINRYFNERYTNYIDYINYLNEGQYDITIYCLIDENKSINNIYSLDRCSHHISISEDNKNDIIFEFTYIED